MSDNEGFGLVEGVEADDDLAARPGGETQPVVNRRS